MHSYFCIQLGEETWVLDLTPWAGDRRLVSLNLMDEAYSKYGILRRVFVDLGYKRLGLGAFVFPILCR